MTLTNAHSQEGDSPSGLWAEASGHGPDVLLVHGALGDYRQWGPIAERLRPQYRVVALSRRYHWPNRPPPADALYSYESHCDDLLKYLSSHTGRVHLAGHSYGAGIVLLAALRAPSVVETLTLVEPPFGSLLPESAPGLEEEVASRNSMLAQVRALVREGSDEQAGRMLIEWTQGGPERFESLTQETRRGLRENAKTIGPTFSSAPPTVTREQLRALRVRTLVVNGEHTRMHYRLIGEAVASCVPDATAAQLSGAGHMAIVERPMETAALMLEFLGS